MRAITVMQVAWHRVMSVEVERNGGIPEVRGQGKGGMEHGSKVLAWTPGWMVMVTREDWRRKWCEIQEDGKQ